MQEHGAPLPGLASALRERGAEVVEVPMYRWVPPLDPEPVRQLAEATARGEVHALLFTSAPAITSFLEHAEAAGKYETVLERLRTDVLPLCVGAVRARPLLRWAPGRCGPSEGDWERWSTCSPPRSPAATATSSRPVTAPWSSRATRSSSATAPRRKRYG
ncbi:uroporphyrinogen-III synthase [Streptomyces seoulensis]|uniref:uroporphyrinogen-III synthase n=1 Tax=Streptomyces seoulensis TaxID=73044 RepID=UPI00099CB16C|nr:uroporphyrinogen-III synthase [Streptomyces seoulensis]